MSRPEMAPPSDPRLAPLSDSERRDEGFALRSAMTGALRSFPEYNGAPIDSFEAGDTVIPQEHWKVDAARLPLKTVTFTHGQEGNQTRVTVVEDKVRLNEKSLVMVHTQDVTIASPSGETVGGRITYYSKDGVEQEHFSPHISSWATDGREMDEGFGGSNTRGAVEGYEAVVGMLMEMANTPTTEVSPDDRLRAAQAESQAANKHMSDQVVAQVAAAEVWAKQHSWERGAAEHFSVVDEAGRLLRLVVVGGHIHPAAHERGPRYLRVAVYHTEDQAGQDALLSDNLLWVSEYNFLNNGDATGSVRVSSSRLGGESESVKVDLSHPTHPKFIVIGIGKGEVPSLAGSPVQDAIDTNHLLAAATYLGREGEGAHKPGDRVPDLIPPSA